jgi:DNA-binding beta-propeller fold protein YncE
MFKKIKICKFLGIFFVMIFALSTLSGTQAVGVTASISVGIGPQGIAYDWAKDEIFVANSYNNTVPVILDSS